MLHKVSQLLYVNDKESEGKDYNEKNKAVKSLAKKRKIKDGDLCKIFNDIGETFAHAIIKDSMLEGVASTQKQYRGSLVKNGLNANALNSQDLTDMGDGPIFYTVLAQIKRV